MTNQGVAPLNPGTLVGQVRALIGDTAYVPSNPIVNGLADYSMFSDVDLAAFLTVANNSVNRAVGNGYMRIAGSLALKSADAKAQDMAVDISKRADQFTKLAQQQFALADQDDQLGRNPANNIALVFSTNKTPSIFSLWRTPLFEDYFGTPAASPDGSLIFTQTIPALVWTIAINGQYRNVVVSDSLGNTVLPVVNITSTFVTLTFTTATAGIAIVS